MGTNAVEENFQGIFWSHYLMRSLKPSHAYLGYSEKLILIGC